MRQRGSHRVIRRGSKGCVIPMHSELKVGTLSGALRQAEISPEEFIAALQRDTRKSDRANTSSRPTMFSYDSLNAPPLRLRAAEFQLETFKASLRAGFITGLPRFARNDEAAANQIDRILVQRSLIASGGKALP